jgi:hypothetical protein
MFLRTGLVQGSSKMAGEKLNLTTTLKNKTSANSQIEGHKKSHDLRLLRPQTQHRNPEGMYLKLLTQLTPYVEKIVNLLLGFK